LLAAYEKLCSERLVPLTLLSYYDVVIVHLSIQNKNSSWHLCAIFKSIPTRWKTSENLGHPSFWMLAYATPGSGRWGPNFHIFL